MILLLLLCITKPMSQWMLLLKMPLYLPASKTSHTLTALRVTLLATLWSHRLEAKTRREKHRDQEVTGTQVLHEDHCLSSNNHWIAKT
jgi:hypothetical protein